jgi:hypothetical protein
MAEGEAVPDPSGREAFAAIWLVESIVNEDVEDFHVFRATEEHPEINRERALRAVLKTASFSLPLDEDSSAAQFRVFAGRRPHARCKITHYVRSNGEADGELTELEGGPKDIKQGEHESFLARALALTTARVLEELQESG